MNSLTQTIIETGKAELANQVSQSATTVTSHVTSTLNVLGGLPWWTALLLVIIALYVAYWAYKTIRFLMRWGVIVGLGGVLLYFIIRYTTTIFK